MSAPQSALFVGIGNMGWPMAARLLGAGIGRDEAQRWFALDLCGENAD